MGLAFFNAARKVGRQHVLDPYTEDLRPVRDEGFGAYAARVSKPYARAVARHFDPEQADADRARARPSRALTDGGGATRLPRVRGADVRRRGPRLAGTLPALLEETRARAGSSSSGAELPGGHLSYVCEAATADGADAVLKLGPPWPRVRHEIARAPGLGRDRRAVAAAATSQLHALLLERIRPGDACRTRYAGSEVARSCGAIHVAPPGGLPPLGETVQRRLDLGERRGPRLGARSSPGHCGDASSELEADRTPRCSSTATSTSATSSSAPDAALCAIDPLPCVGDPAYDAAYWVHANRRPGPPGAVWTVLVAATGLPRERVRDWAGVVARARLSARRSTAGRQGSRGT